MKPASDASVGVAFGRFRVLPHRREVLADGQPIKLGGRAFDLLMALIEARGTVLNKDALMARVWPGRAVEEHNLLAQISALRAAFGAERDLIRTVSGRGYQFTGEIRVLLGNPDERAPADIAAAGPAVAMLPTNLPQPVSGLIGRDEELGEIVRLATEHRLVSLTGPGGIGKTRLALTAARQLLPHFADGAWLTEFSPLTDPGLVPATVAAAVGLELGGAEASVQRVAQAIAGRQMLLVLDTCEHIVGAAAALAETVLRTGPNVRLLATSREPLEVEAEWAYPVPPLTVPAQAGEQGDLLQYSAVRLFVERARAANPHFALEPRLVASIAAICRQLDGMPLAIEMAAARAATLGIQELAVRLDNRFQLLARGRRTALPRHQTLRATLDWSYGLLAEPERVVLRRLAVFAGAFNLKAASAVAASPDISPPEVVESLLSLAAKSLVSAEISGAMASYRLLDTTRAYAFEKLSESGEREGVQRRHAEFYRELFERAETEWKRRPSSAWLSEYGRQVDNVRAALDWALSPGGDASIGVALTAAAVPLWMHLSLLDECHSRAEQSLSRLAAGTDRDARREMKLQAALGASLTYTRGTTAPKTGAAWTEALEIAESLGDAEYQLRSLRGLWAFHTASGRYRVGLAFAERFHIRAKSRSDPNDRLVGEQLIGASLHYLGAQPDARRHLERVLADHPAVAHRRSMIRFQIDLIVVARVALARVLWLQGFPDQAVRTAERGIEDARAGDHAVSLCYALGLGACQIALLVGDLTTAEQCVEGLLDYSTRHGLAQWRALCACYQGALAIKRGDVMTGSRLLRAGFNEIGDSMLALSFMVLQAIEALGHASQVLQGVSELNETIERPDLTEECWLTADLLRLKGELILWRGTEGAAAEAEDHFRQALDWARRQGALSLELRAATSLAQLLRGNGHSADAIALLEPIYGQFTEGFDTADLKAARELLDALQY